MEKDSNVTRKVDEFLQIFKRGEEFTKDLIKENERLRFRIAELEESVEKIGNEGTIRLYEDRIKLLEESFEAFEPKFKERWVTLPDDYRNELLDGIVAFEISVTNIEGKFKLSQNRTEGDRERIIENLGEKKDKVKADIAEFMKKEKDLHSK
jgi:hypothetical protein